jgi:hypothetical protein
MWHIWPGTLRPASLLEERQFVADLRSRVSRPSKATRDDVTALISLLRCGTTVDEAFMFAPGLKAGKLLAAHVRLDSLRLASLEAWERIVADPTRARWRLDHRVAARLFPVAVERVAIALESDPTPQRLRIVVGQVAARMKEVSAAASLIERKAAVVTQTLPYASALAAALYTPNKSCAYGDSFFVPDRVAVLSPTRVGDLLGDPHV